MINVLVTGTGGGVGQSIIKSLKLSQLAPNIIASDVDPLAAGLYRCSKGYLVPLATHPKFIETIVNICRKEKIDAILIGSDPELPAFANNKEAVEQQSGAKVIVSSPEVVAIGYDKWKTYAFLKNHSLPHPKSALPENMEALLDEVGFPVIVKPRTGSASRDVYVAENREELNVFIKRARNPIIQQYVGNSSEEYTSGVVRFDGHVCGAITMKRDLKGGTTYRAVVDDYDDVRNAATTLANEINPFGPCNFQMRMVEGIPTAFEINTRFSGTTALRSGLGFTEVEAVLKYVLFGEYQPLTYRKGIITRYWNEVYLHSEEYDSIQKEQSLENHHSQVIDYF